MLGGTIWRIVKVASKTPVRNIYLMHLRLAGWGGGYRICCGLQPQEGETLEWLWYWAPKKTKVGGTSPLGCIAARPIMRHTGGASLRFPLVAGSHQYVVNFQLQCRRLKPSLAYSLALRSPWAVTVGINHVKHTSNLPDSPEKWCSRVKLQYASLQLAHYWRLQCHLHSAEEEVERWAADDQHSHHLEVVSAIKSEVP